MRIVDGSRDLTQRLEGPWSNQSMNKLATIIPPRAATHELPSERGLSPREIASAVHTILNEQAGAVRAVPENAARAVTATVSAEGP